MLRLLCLVCLMCLVRLHITANMSLWSLARGGFSDGPGDPGIGASVRFLRVIRVIICGLQ